MKKLSLLISALLMLALSTKASTKTTLSIGEAKKEWNEKMLTINGNTITFDAGKETKTDNDDNKTEEDAYANAALSWLSEATNDLSSYDRLVFELEEASDGVIEVGVSNGGYWGKTSLHKLEKGETKLSLELSELKITSTPGDNDTWKTGDALDLENINMIFMRTDWCHSQTIKVKEFYIEKDKADNETSEYDVILQRTLRKTSPFPLAAGALDLTIWGEGNTYDATTKTLTFGEAYNSIGWTYDEAKDFSSFDKLKIDLQQSLSAYSEEMMVQLHVVAGEKNYWMELPKTQKAITISLNEAVWTVTENSTDTKEQKISNRADVKKVYFWTWTKGGKIKLKSVYLENGDKQTDCIVRENRTAKYGTVCLPFAAEKPYNATLYTVKGVDCKDAPSKLYIEEADVIEAGKAYIYQSDDAEDVAFYKSDETGNLSSATAATDLIGNFDEANATAGHYILVSNKWKKANANSKVGKYRASLNLDAVSVLSGNEAAAKYMGIGMDETTGISTVKDYDATSAYHTLGGLRIAQPTRGLYIVNGKKAIVK